MPVRKSESSETTSKTESSRRSSLRRLSSLASLHALNPFSRRRSANNVNGTPSSTSLASLSSLALDSSPSEVVSQPEDAQIPLQSPAMPQSLLSSRRSSYVCLPDDPIGGMPRSRTYSNLPVPTTRNKTRLPMALNSNKSKLSRCDTEPLLQSGLSGGDTAGQGRSTAFKENLSLSPVKRLPSIDLTDNKALYGSMLPCGGYASRHGWGSPAHTHSSSTTSLNQSAGPKKYNSSPVRRATRESSEAPAAPGGPMQRWGSQPVLPASHRASFHGEIRQNRLLSAIQAPSPPPAQSSPPLRLFSEQAQGYTDAPTPTARPRAHSVKTVTGIHQAEPLAYWTGRFSSLNDKFRNEELLASLNSSTTETDKTYTSEANHARMRRAVEYLWYQCTTDEAKQSFVRWQKQLASVMSVPELGKPVGDSATVKSCALEMSLKSGEGDEGPPSSGNKVRFMDKLFGKKTKFGLAA